MSTFDKLKKAIIKSVISRYSVYIIQVGTLAIYSRLFTPEVFGIFAAIQVFSIFFLMLGEVGLGPAIINFKTLSEKDKNGLFSLTLVIGIIICILFYLFSFWLNYFYNRDDYQYISIFICISIIFSCINTLPNSFLIRERFFFRLAFSDILSEIIAFFIVVYVYYNFEPLYALAVRPCVVSIFRFIINYTIHLKWTEFGIPRLYWYPKAVKPILKFSSYQFSFNVLNYFSRNLDNILVGKYFGLTSLGVYDKSYMLMKYPLQLVSFAIGPALQPILSSECKDINEVRIIHDKLIFNLSFISCLIGFLIYSNSDLIVFIILGEQWDSVVGLLTIFSFSIPIQIILSTSGSVFQSLNETRLMFISGVFSSFVNIIGMILSINFGDIYILATVLFFTFLINFIQCYYLMYKNIFNESVVRFLFILIPSLLSMCLSFLLYNCLNYYFSLNMIYKLFYSISLSFLIFFVVYWLCGYMKIYKKVSYVS
ncbi:oligosaccharide flippase family protein [Aliivibrio sifiae]|uniref:Lipopolysaccharide biosynthesis protein n=1 Tax=Aliivibrio sifiae TaxID=566293 RepID=A0A2S7X5U5_9GAMM|nr:oligosaccharide flippase family protein [Aliivibrio sifiae]PQJ85409.1 hypothetical protein BTO23_19000 [Aliivibrio sifiae]GLR76413.1 lipopolysaccharide biosynthesis protein [Aliivibrio sifiae]